MKAGNDNLDNQPDEIVEASRKPQTLQNVYILSRKAVILQAVVECENTGNRNNAKADMERIKISAHDDPENHQGYEGQSQAGE